MCVCGKCGRHMRSEEAVRSHMQAKHGYDAKMGPDFRYYPDKSKPTKVTKATVTTTQPREDRL